MGELGSGSGRLRGGGRGGFWGGQASRKLCGSVRQKSRCGLSKLGETVKDRPRDYAGKRYMTRILCHAYNNGIVRSAVENRNLRAHARDHDVTFAESFKTCATTVFSGIEYLQMVDNATGNKVVHFQKDLRNPKRPKLTSKSMALLYGYRPMKTAELKYLSPYEFTMYWEPQLLRYPLSPTENNTEYTEATLTPVGLAKLAESQENELVSGVDYVVKETGGSDWVPLENLPGTTALRHEWILRRRLRPMAPHFKGCPLPKHQPGSGEQNAKIALAYFHPWTLREEEWSDEHVPRLRDLKRDCESWDTVLKEWLDGNIISEESRRYVGNFISMHRLRPGGGDDEGLANPDDMIEDEPVYVTADRLEDVLETRIGGKTNQGDDLELLGDSHHMNSSEAVRLGRDVWAHTCGEEGSSTQPHFHIDEDKVKAALQSAKDSRSKEKKFSAQTGANTRGEREAVVAQRAQATREDVQEWLKKLKTRQRDDGRLFVNAKQYEAITKVAERVMAELPERQGCAAKVSPPLRWVLHGGPGTGKTHVVRDVIKDELFEQILSWRQGLDYQVIALQAVMADLLKGDTIHHACGIPVRKKGSDGEMVVQSHKAVAEQSLYWRWLIIDEFGMVGSSLLAEVDMKLRDVIVDVNPHKKNAGGHSYPFGGLNVLLSGDLWQLPPPSGGFVGNIPAEFICNSRKYNPAVTISHGQSLLWGGVDHSDWAFHGITELEESERCREDPWLQEVQLELREGRLSEDSHAFLHGMPTTVSGSWTDGVAVCGNAQCQRVSGENQGWEEIQKCERTCQLCAETRKRRERVAQDAADPRFTEAKFVDAPAIFPNNDIKYDVNKQRARQYAAAHGLGVTWVQAQDKPLPKTLQEKPDLVLHKMSWLSRHDRECGDLYGMFPLVEGLPVALTDHLDRNPEKQLLRGKIGKIHSWKVSATEESVWENDVRILHEMPEVVFVKYEGCKWQIEGTDEPGIYPVTMIKRNWYLDKGRKYPQLAVQRMQLPLALGAVGCAQSGRSGWWVQGRPGARTRQHRCLAKWLSKTFSLKFK